MDIQPGLISVLTPCYNSDRYVDRLLDSILKQDYPNVEMVIIDDGSTDHTSEIARSYEARFKQKGFKFFYVYQENQGLAASINNGLKLLHGEYILWPDSDDYYNNDKAFTKMVNQFNLLSDEYAVVRCLSNFEKGNKVVPMPVLAEYGQSEQFENCLENKNFYFGAGNYMVKANCLDKAIPQREIYVEKGAGQNIQIFYPMLYCYECFTLQEHLHTIVEREDSHGRINTENYVYSLARQTAYENTAIGTIERMPMLTPEEKKKYLHMIKERYLGIKFDLALRMKEFDDAKRFIKGMERLQRKMQYRMRIKKFCYRHNLIINIFHKIIDNVRNK